MSRNRSPLPAGMVQGGSVVVGAAGTGREGTQISGTPTKPGGTLGDSSRKSRMKYGLVKARVYILCRVYYSQS